VRGFADEPGSNISPDHAVPLDGAGGTSSDPRQARATEETAGIYGLTGGGTKLDWVSTVNFR
jgi:hypothetical protein